MMIEQDSNDLVLVLGEGLYDRGEAILEGGTIHLLSPQPAGWIAGCIEGTYWYELWFDREEIRAQIHLFYRLGKGPISNAEFFPMPEGSECWPSAEG